MTSSDNFLAAYVQANNKRISSSQVGLQFALMGLITLGGGMFCTWAVIFDQAGALLARGIYFSVGLIFVYTGANMLLVVRDCLRSYLQSNATMRDLGSSVALKEVSR